MQFFLNYSGTLFEIPVFVVKTTILIDTVLRTTVFTLNSMVDGLYFNVIFELCIFLFKLSEENVGTSFGA